MARRCIAVARQIMSVGCGSIDHTDHTDLLERRCMLVACNASIYFLQGLREVLEKNSSVRVYYLLVVDTFCWRGCL